MNAMETVRYMIVKELQRNDLTELCEGWGVEVSDFFRYLDKADKAIKEEPTNETV